MSWHHFQTGNQFFDGQGDFVDIGEAVVGRTDQFLGLLDEMIVFPGFLGNIAHGDADALGIFLNLLGGVLHPFGQVSHFIRHDGETPSMFSGSCGFNGRVQGEQIGLVGYFPDRVDDLKQLIS
jgi:hypothetical protein